MGIIFDYKVEETQIMSAYGLIVYGKINMTGWELITTEWKMHLLPLEL